MTKKANLVIVCVFTAFLALFFTMNLISPDKEFSPQENRYLQQAPTFTLKSLFSGAFTNDFEKYITDQFVWRDAWTSLKARCELLTGKKENNGVYYCDGETLIERFTAPKSSVIDANMHSLNALVENIDVPVFFALIPDAVEIKSDLLPKNAVTDSQKAMIELAYGQSLAENVDMITSLAAHADEYIYYRTDHHWTSLGAYYGYEALCDAMGLACPALDTYTRLTASEDFYGTNYSKSGFSWIKPDSIETFVPDDGSVTVMRYLMGTAEDGQLYDESYLAVKDKYSIFLGGNAPRLTIQTKNTDGPRLLIIRDSFMDSLAPFLLDNFAQIDLLDLRYYRESVSQYVQDGDFDAVLVLYSIDTFCTDLNMFLLGM